MTSYTKKLYKLDPAAATAIHRREYGSYRYGRHVTLAGFTPAEHGLGRPFRAQSETQSGYGYGAGLAAPTFGKREVAPSLPAFECWAPELGKPKSVVRASDSFMARKAYALHHQIVVSDVAARLMMGGSEPVTLHCTGCSERWLHCRCRTGRE